MRPSRLAVGSSLLVATLLSGAGVAGCTTEAPVPSVTGSDDRDKELPLPEGAAVMGEFKVHLAPGGKMEIWRITRPEPGITPLSQSELTIVSDDVTGSGPANTVELVTNSTGTDGQCPVQTTNSYCGNVTLRHFFTSQGFNNVYVQVTKIFDANYADIANHQAVNSDPSALGLSNTLGLWRYTADAYVAKANPSGIFDKAPTNNAGTRDWVFNRPDNVDTYLILRVVASPTYTNYTRTPTKGAGVTWIDACSLAGATKGTGTSYTTTLPFPFTLYGGGNTAGAYGYTSLQVSYNWKGAITLAGVAGPSGLDTSLPCGYPCPTPAILPFWENLTFGSGQVCSGLTGAAPNRKFVVTWSNMAFTTDATASLTFSAYLYEGTDKFEFVYRNMTSSTNQSRANGGTAVIGAQNAMATLATPQSTKGGITFTATPASMQSFLFTPFF